MASTFIRDVCKFVPDYMASYLKRQSWPFIAVK